MAFPVIEGTAESSVNTAGTSHTVTLPASIAASDLVLIIMDIGSTSATLNALTDWTESLDEAVANGLKIIRYTGAGVPSNPTFTSSASTRSASIAYRISGADKATAPQIGTTATGTSATPNPPSVTPTGGISKDYLFIAFYGAAGEEADDDTWSDTPPTNYTPSPPLQKACGTAGTNLGGMIAAASRQLTTGAAEDPGTFAKDVSAAWRAQTIIIHPDPNATATPAAISMAATLPAPTATGGGGGGGITATLLASGQSGWDTATETGFVSPSISPGANCVLVLEVGAIDGGVGDADLLTTGHTVVSSGSGPTWTKQSHQDTAASFVMHAAVWTAVIGGSDPGSFTVTVDWAGAAVSGAYAYSIHKATGHDTSSPFGGVITTVAQAGNGAVTATLSAAPATDDVAIALNVADDNNGGSGATFGSTFGTWTETGDGTGSGDDVAWNTGWRTSSTSTSVEWSDVNTGADNFSSCQAAIVVKAAAGGGGDDTATPAAIAAVVTVPAASTQGSTTATPAAISTPVAVPAATRQGGAAPTPATIAATFAFDTANIDSSAGVDAVAVTVAVPQASATGGGSANAAPSAISIPLSIPSAAARAGATAAPTVITVSVTLPASTEQAGATASPAVIPLTVTLPAASASGTNPGTASPATITTTVTLPSVAPLAGSTASPAATTLTVTMPAAVASGSRTATPAVIPVTVTVPQATASGATAGTATPATVQLVAAVHTPAPQHGYIVNPQAIALAVTIGAVIAQGTPPDPAPATVTLTGAGFTITAIVAGSAATFRPSTHQIIGDADG